MVSWETNFTNFLAPAHNLHQGLEPTWKWVPAIPINVSRLPFQHVLRCYSQGKLSNKHILGLDCLDWSKRS